MLTPSVLTIGGSFHDGTRSSHATASIFAENCVAWHFQSQDKSHFAVLALVFELRADRAEFNSVSLGEGLWHRLCNAIGAKTIAGLHPLLQVAQDSIIYRPGNFSGGPKSLVQTGRCLFAVLARYVSMLLPKIRLPYCQQPFTDLALPDRSDISGGWLGSHWKTHVLKQHKVFMNVIMLSKNIFNFSGKPMLGLCLEVLTNFFANGCLYMEDFFDSCYSNLQYVQLKQHFCWFFPNQELPIPMIQFEVWWLGPPWGHEYWFIMVHARNCWVRWSRQWPDCESYEHRLIFLLQWCTQLVRQINTTQ